MSERNIGKSTSNSGIVVGDFALVACPELQVGAWTTLVFRYVVGAEGLPPHAVLRIGLPNTAWSEPLVPLPRFWPEAKGKRRTYAPFRRVNTTVELVTQSRAQGWLRSFTAMFPTDLYAVEGTFGEKVNWRYWIDVVIEEAALAEGDVIRVVYGDMRFGEPGARVQAVPQSTVAFTAYLDAKGNGDFVELPQSPIRRQVHPGAPGQARVAVPSIVRPGESFAARVSVTDTCGNRPRGHFVGSLSADAVDWKREMPFDKDSPLHAEASGLALQSENEVLRVVVKGDLPETRSNPALCCASGDRIFWGDLHVHSMYHDYNAEERRGIWGDVAPDECFAYAREVSFLDFVAVTDSDPSRPGWEPIQTAVDEYYRPGSFVSFRGFEAGLEEGHRHVIFATGGVDPQYPPDFDWSFPALHDAFRDRDDVLMIPHHTKAFPTWDHHDPHLEPEVYSSWGSSEEPGSDLWEKMSAPGGSVHDALRRGFRLGMVSGGDICPWPGRSHPGTVHSLAPYPGGLTAVFASELTREAVFDAVRSRRCYATTGARIILKFDISGAPMGDTARLASPDQPRHVAVSVIGTYRIDRVEILKNCGVLASREAGDERSEWSFTDESRCEPGDFYYLRVFQADGARAWSSPIWMEVG